MKKSEQYRKAQLAVLYSNLRSNEKVEIIKTLGIEEDLAKMTEKREAENSEREREQA